MCEGEPSLALLTTTTPPQVNINIEDAESFFPRTHLRLGSSESGFQNSNLTPGEDEGIWEVPIIHLACGLFWRKNLALSF